MRLKFWPKVKNNIQQRRKDTIHPSINWKIFLDAGTVLQFEEQCWDIPWSANFMHDNDYYLLNFI
jgi:hypothetical protein